MLLGLRRKVINAGSFLITATIVGNFLNLAYNAYLGKELSLAQFGSITLINTLLYIVNIFLNALASTVNQRVSFLSARSGKPASTKFFIETRKKLLLFSVGIVALWLLCLPLLQSYFRLESPVPLLSFIPVLLLGFIAASSGGYIKGSFLFVWSGIFLLVEAVSKLILSHVFIQSNNSDFTYLSIPISMLIAFLVSITVAHRESQKHKSAKPHEYRFNTYFYLAAILTGISTNAFLTFDVLLTKHYFSPVESGTYAFLALFGKMIYFFGSLFNTFMISFVSRDEGARRDPNRQFYLLLTASTTLTMLGFLGLVMVGPHILPFVFGNKIAAIQPYLTTYSLAIALYTISNTINVYHLARKQYLFPITSLIIIVGMILGINAHHTNLHEVIESILLTSGINLITLLSLHFIQKNGGFFLMNIVDLFDLFKPIPKLNYTPLGKRILIFNWRDTKHSFAGGAETYVHELGKRWVKDGNSVTLFCGNDGNCARYEVIDGIQVIRRGGFYTVYMWAMLYYAFRLRRRFDIIIDCENGIPFFTPLYAKEQKFLLIHHVHQEVFRRSLAWPLSSIASFLEIRVMPYVYQRTQFITISPSTREEILTRRLTKIDPIIIYNGVDKKKYKPGKKSSVPTIMYLGRLQYYKSINVFIKMAKSLGKAYPKAKFIIAGQGEEQTKLKSYAHRIGANVSFLGKVTEEMKIKLMQSAWVVINPSSMEGWGLTVIEANACGTPVVASNVPGLRDSVKDGYSGYLAPYNDTITFVERTTWIISKKQLRTKMNQNALKWAQKFNWDTASKYSLKVLAKHK